ncbi:HET-E [Ganoderma leucocontextum]|nr:HET-E [Ganoderma leucocontextum]
MQGIGRGTPHFPHGSILFHSATVERRGRRASFWYSNIKRAFPRLNERGLLTSRSTDPDTVADPVAHEFSGKCLVVSQDSKRTFTASSDGTIIIWDTERSAILQEWLAHHGPVRGLALSPDGRRLVSAGGMGSGSLTVWNIGSGSDVRKAASLEGYTQELTACTWSPGGTLIASASEDGTMCVWDALTFHQRDLFELDGWHTASNLLKYLQFSPDARYLAWISKPLPHTLNGSDTCSMWRPLVGERPKKLRLPSDPSRRDASINALSFDPEGRRIATAHGSSYRQHEGNVVRISGDVATGAALAALAGHTRYVADVSFSPDGRSVLSAAVGVAKIWDAQSWEETASFDLGGWTDIHWKACFSPGGKHVATASLYGDSKVQLWRIEDGSCVAAFPEHGRSVEHVAFSPNGEFLVSGDEGGMVHIRRISSFTQH